MSHGDRRPAPGRGRGQRPQQQQRQRMGPNHGHGQWMGVRGAQGHVREVQRREPPSAQMGPDGDGERGRHAAREVLRRAGGHGIQHERGDGIREGGEQEGADGIGYDASDLVRAEARLSRNDPRGGRNLLQNRRRTAPLSHRGLLPQRTPRFTRPLPPKGRIRRRAVGPRIRQRQRGPHRNGERLGHDRGVGWRHELDVPAV
mmetsp:Transcript_37918/g.91475  ORF Transcript_37918/g.91475 Transcript_37918/m.91475 type:complete len:202 (+) Transcript_37918:108-713(+)